MPPAAQGQWLDWRQVALRVGEELAASGPNGYYDMTPEQWRDWALAALRAPVSPSPQGEDWDAVKAHGYLSRLITSVFPQCKPLPDLMGVCTQVDHLLATADQWAKPQPSAVPPPAPDVLDGPRNKTPLDREYEKALDIINRQRERIEQLEAALRPPVSPAPEAREALVFDRQAVFHSLHSLRVWLDAHRDGMRPGIARKVLDEQIAALNKVIEVLSPRGSGALSPPQTSRSNRSDGTV